MSTHEKNALILGGGMVGSVMAADMASDFSTTLADINPSPAPTLLNMLRFPDP